MLPWTGANPDPFGSCPFLGGDVMGQTVKARALRCAPSRADHIGFVAVQQPANKNVSNTLVQLMLRLGGGEFTAGSGAGPD